MKEYGLSDCPLENEILHQQDKIRCEENDKKSKEMFKEFLRVRDDVYKAIKTEDKEVFLNVLFYFAADFISHRFMHNRNKFFSDEELIQKPGIIDGFLRADVVFIQNSAFRLILDSLKKNTSNE